MELLKQYYISQIDYELIKGKKAELEVKPSKEDKLVIADYQKKIEHDEKVFEIWKKELKTDPDSEDNRAFKEEVLSEFKADRQRALDEIQKQIDIINEL